MTTFGEQLDTLAARAERDLAAFAPPEAPPDEDRALSYLTGGAGPAIGCYIDARSGEWVRFDPDEFERLEAAMNTWLELYAACYGVDITAAFTVREAAELLVDTHDIRDVAQLLTHVPDRGVRVDG